MNALNFSWALFLLITLGCSEVEKKASTTPCQAPNWPDSLVQVYEHKNLFSIEAPTDWEITGTKAWDFIQIAAPPAFENDSSEKKQRSLKIMVLKHKKNQSPEGIANKKSILDGRKKTVYDSYWIDVCDFAIYHYANKEKYPDEPNILLKEIYLISTDKFLIKFLGHINEQSPNSETLKDTFQRIVKSIRFKDIELEFVKPFNERRKKKN